MRGRRANGTNQRALGTNPRARKVSLRNREVSLRDLGLNPKDIEHTLESFNLQIEDLRDFTKARRKSLS